MSESDHPDILLVDDGELDDLARQLGVLGLDFERVLGLRESGSVAPPAGILITTARRASAVRRGSPPGAGTGHPIRIVAVTDDIPSTRRLLRRTGFHLVVRLPVHDEVLRVVANHALYAGNERREDPRVAVGSTTRVEAPGQAPGVLLMDISNRGCRLLGHEAFEVGQRLSVQVPDREGDDAPLRIPGRVARIGRVDAMPGEPAHVGAVVFDPGMDEADRMQLGMRINRWSIGPASLSEGGLGPAVPACASREIPGLMLDEETDPAVRIDTHIEATWAGAGGEVGTDPGAERRAHARAQFAVPVIARGRSQRRLLIGRDLSKSGMRVEPASGVVIGDRFMLALHGTNSGEPIVVTATVARDDGPSGLGLRFDRLSGARAEALEKLVGCLPELDSLEEGEEFGLGAVIGEWIGDAIADTSSED
jgi:hypothetical protein